MNQGCKALVYVRKIQWNVILPQVCDELYFKVCWLSFIPRWQHITPISMIQSHPECQCSCYTTGVRAYNTGFSNVPKVCPLLLRVVKRYCVIDLKSKMWQLPSFQDFSQFKARTKIIYIPKLIFLIIRKRSCVWITCFLIDLLNTSINCYLSWN